MIHFVFPHLLWLLLALPLLALIKSRMGRSPAIVFPSTNLFSGLGSGRANRIGSMQVLLRLLSLALLIVAAARPQYGTTTNEVEASGIDILLAVDVSGSMEALDFTLHGKPANRLDVVKNVVTTFIEDRPNDRIGLVAFAGRPYVLSPLTLDHSWLLKRLQTLSTGMMEDGTAIGSAIASATNRLRDREAKSRIVILLTDGINNTGNVPPAIAAEAAETLKIKVYTIGAGTRGEAPVPVVDQFGRKQIRMARVDLDEASLRMVAEKTGAQYFRATDTESLQKIYQEINAMETTTRTITHFANHHELFPYLLIAALILIVGEIISQRKRIP